LRRILDAPIDRYERILFHLSYRNSISAGANGKKRTDCAKKNRIIMIVLLVALAAATAYYWISK
jgi:hypothetical protein